MRPGPTLPIDDVLDDVVDALRQVRRVVVQAPPGAGKTTRIPLALLELSLPPGHRVVVLEPRRLAARAAARRMAQLLGEPVGRTVGYVTRDERVVSDATRVEVVTEGILVRRIQRSPELPGVSAVLFDEFHERSLDADLGLAFALEVQEALRPDLRLVVMSATLDGARVAALLDGAPTVVSEGRAYPVEVHHRPRTLSDPLAPAVAAVVHEALEAGPGDVLAFLPGAGEIRRVQRELEGRVGAGVLVAPLYGALAPQEQDRAIDPAPPGARKVVLATDIAETSLTIEGVRAVVDAGLSREPRIDPGNGMSRLVTVRASRSSADQRCGRAGRVAPGRCYRLWSRREHHGLDPHRRPEIVQADLARFALEVARWGAGDVAELRLLDPPPQRTYAQAVALLQDLEVLDGAGRPTDHGRAVAQLPTHPRLAHAVLRGAQRGLGGLACEVAAVLTERDVLAVDRDASVADLAARIAVVRGARPPRGTRLRRGALARTRRDVERFQRALELVGGEPAPAGREEPDRAGALLALAYPDRVAQRREGQRGAFLLSNGRGAVLPDTDVLAGEDLLVAADVDAGRGEARIRLAAPIDEPTLRDVLGSRLTVREVITWDRDVGDVVAQEEVRLGALVLEARRLEDLGDERTTPALLTGIATEGLELLPWDRETRDLRARVAFLRRTFGEAWPDLSDETLLGDLGAWLAPFLAGARRRTDLAQVPLRDALRARVGWDRLERLDELAPTHLRVPSGSRIRLDYQQGDVPVLAVRVQELFGATRTPRVAGGAVPVLLHLLSPAHRPLQVTQDLAGFWTRHWPQVRAEMLGRYPKHRWPEDPLSAEPTARTTKRR